ncbi:MAG: ROK family protein [Mycobacterium sp.]
MTFAARPAPAEATIGVDIGGTKVLAGVVDTDGRIHRRVQTQTPRRSQAPVVVEDTIVAVVEQLRTAYDVSAVGVGAAGFVARSGAVRFAPHLSWRDEPLQDVLTARLDLPVAVDNDANTAALAEMTFGAGRGYRHAICVTLGTGIGGALVVDGQVFRGTQGFTGEFGHMQVVPDGRDCECGQRGCWEQYCSGKALVRAARAVGAAADVTGQGVTQAAASGQAWALKAFGEVGAWLGIGLAGLVSAFDPEVVLIGGGLSDADALLLSPARSAFADRLPGAGYRAVPPLLRAALGADAGFIGAAELARSLVEPDAAH